MDLRTCLIVAFSSAVASSVWAASPADRDWPCVQRKVPALSTGAVWSGPPLDPGSNEWRNQPEMASLVPKLVSRRTSLEETTKLIDEFAAKAGADKARLTTLFGAVFSEINTLRSDIIKGIERLSVGQRRRADGIRETRQQIETLTAKKEKAAADQARLAELEESLKWQLRIYEDRESSLTYICETPVILEQRVFAIGRDIQSKLN